MKSKILHGAAHVLVLSAMSASAAIRYVNVNSTSPVSPYNNWTTAATTIQDAVDAAVAGDQILVTNGVYQTGGRAVVGTMTNRVAVNKPVTLQSANGAAVTVIQGFQVPDTTSGAGAIRCVYLGNGAVLVGFTLTNGAPDYEPGQIGGGVWCESTNAVVSNCVLTGNSGGGASGGTLNNCALTGNSGGGAVLCTLNNCMLTGNRGYIGGGAVLCTLYHCTLTANSAVEYGGGAHDCTLNNCVLTGNSANIGFGGAANDCTLNNCTLTGNSASIGGGAISSTLNGCVLTGNSAGQGGGAYGGTLNNCTLTGNSAGSGGGVYHGTLNNCIVYYNSAPNGNNYSGSILSYSCTTPLPPEDKGMGNITAEPQLTSPSHLSAGSPCRGAVAPRMPPDWTLMGKPGPARLPSVVTSIILVRSLGR